jgi:hypothetical protein
MIKIPYWFLALSLSVGFLALGIWAESDGFDHSVKMWIGFMALTCAGGLAIMAAEFLNSAREQRKGK